MLASAMVSRAEKGMFDSIKESFAASKAIAGSPPQIAALVGKGGFPELPKGTPEEVEARTLALLGEAVALLRAKAPDLVDGYRAMVLQSCRDAAAAADDTSGNEQAVIAKVEAAAGLRSAPGPARWLNAARSGAAEAVEDAPPAARRRARAASGRHARSSSPPASIALRIASAVASMTAPKRVSKYSRASISTGQLDRGPRARAHVGQAVGGGREGDHEVARYVVAAGAELRDAERRRAGPAGAAGGAAAERRSRRRRARIRCPAEGPG